MLNQNTAPKPSNAVLDRAEDIYQAMKADSSRNFVKRYGKEAENVMRGRAMNSAKKQVKTMNEEKLKEIIKKKLAAPPVGETFSKEHDDNPALKGGQKKLPDELQAQLVKEDHEVSMAIASLKSVIKSSVTLLNKLGNEERNIPGWIQDHITNAENYIDQAAQGFHELKEGAKVRTEPQGGGRIELVITSKDKAEVEKEIEKIEHEYPSAGYGTMVKKEPYQKEDTWIAVVSRSITSD